MNWRKIDVVKGAQGRGFRKFQDTYISLPSTSIAVVEPVYPSSPLACIRIVYRLLLDETANGYLGHLADKHHHAGNHYNQQSNVHIERDNMIDAARRTQTVRHSLTGDFESAECATSTRRIAHDVRIVSENPVKRQLSEISCDKDDKVGKVCLGPQARIPVASQSQYSKALSSKTYKV
jgi:hypothetical protein